MRFKYNDGGRAKYFAAEKVGDCVTRAIAIATENDYKTVYDTAAKFLGYTPRNGVYKKDVRRLIEHFGGRWVSCMKVGQGCKVHLRDNEIPMDGRLICQLSHHATAVVDGVINDTFDASRDGTRCVYGYWIFN